MGLLYHMNDLCDPDEKTSPRHIYINIHEILSLKES